jgi:hypothetical protein
MELGYTTLILNSPNMDLNIVHDRLWIEVVYGGKISGQSWAIFSHFSQNNSLPSTFLGRSTLSTCSAFSTHFGKTILMDNDKN